MLKVLFIFSCLVSTLFLGCSVASHKRIVSTKSNICENDRMKFCSKVSPGNGAVGDCIRQYIKEISIECKNYIDESNKVFDDAFGLAMKTCESDHERECGNIKKYAARRINCLKIIYLKTPEKISQLCKNEFAKIVDIIPPIQP